MYISGTFIPHLPPDLLNVQMLQVKMSVRVEWESLVQPLGTVSLSHLFSSHVISIGFIFGPALGGFLVKYHYAYPSLAAAGLSLLNLVWYCHGPHFST